MFSEGEYVWWHPRSGVFGGSSQRVRVVGLDPPDGQLRRYRVSFVTGRAVLVRRGVPEDELTRSLVDLLDRD